MDKSSKYFKPIKLTILASISIFYLAFIMIQIFSLKNNSYLISESPLYKLDSVKLMARAYLNGGGRGGGKQYEFEDTNGCSFIIKGRQYNSIINDDFVYDTLQYSGTSLTIYTDREGNENYIKRNKSQNIQVYQVEIGGKKYIDESKVNSDSKSIIITNIIFFSIAYILLFIYFYRLKKLE